MLRRNRSAAMANPWVAAEAAGTTAGERVAADGAPGLVRPALLAPQPGVAPPARRLARRERGERPAVWWLGTHGGAGESTLQRLMPGSLAAGHAWPVGGTRPVLLVARTHRHGLATLGAAAREWASATAPCRVLGAVVIADAPGRLPRELAEQVDLLEGVVPALWCVPWCEPWRTAPATAASAPRGVRKLLEDLTHQLTIGEH